MVAKAVVVDTFAEVRESDVMNLAEEMDHVQEMDKKLLWLEIFLETWNIWLDKAEYSSWEVFKFPFFGWHGDLDGSSFAKKEHARWPNLMSVKGGKVKQPLAVSMVQFDCFRKEIMLDDSVSNVGIHHSEVM